MGYTGVTTHLLTIDPNFLGHPPLARQVTAVQSPTALPRTRKGMISEM